MFCLSSSRPDFTVETMDSFLRNGTWRLLGTWKRAVAPSVPVHEVQFERGGPFLEQRVDGSTGRRRLTDASDRISSKTGSHGSSQVGNR